MVNERSEKYAYLDQLETEELERILRVGAFSDEEEDPDMIDYILEVMVGREKEMDQAGLPDPVKAREDFDRLYRDLQQPLYPSGSAHESAARLDEPTPFDPRRRVVRRYIGIAAIVAALIMILTIPAFGQTSLLEMFAQWTGQHFSFRSTEPQLDQIPEEYVELQAVLADNGYGEATVPKKIPEGFQAGEPSLYISDRTGDVVFAVKYTQGVERIVYNLVANFDTEQYIYEQSGDVIDFYEYNDVEHFIYYNNEMTVATWKNGRIEYMITTTLEIAELKSIIDSMY